MLCDCAAPSLKDRRATATKPLSSVLCHLSSGVPSECPLAAIAFPENHVSEILAHRRNFLASPPDRGRPSQWLAAFPVNLVLRYREKHLVFVIGLVHQ